MEESDFAAKRDDGKGKVIRCPEPHAPRRDSQCGDVRVGKQGEEILEGLKSCCVGDLQNKGVIAECFSRIARGRWGVFGLRERSGCVHTVCWMVQAAARRTAGTRWSSECSAPGRTSAAVICADGGVVLTRKRTKPGMYFRFKGV